VGWASFPQHIRDPWQ